MMTSHVNANRVENGVEYFRFEDLTPIPTKYGLMFVFLTSFSFHILNKLVDEALPMLAFIMGMSRQTDLRKHKNYWKMKNLFVSWTHALIVGIWNIMCFIREPEMLEDLVAYHSPFTYGMVAFSTGYFIYDFGDIILSRKLVQNWEVAIHHIAVTSIFMYNIVTCRCIAYNIIALLAEVNSFFLHSRKLLQMSGTSFSDPVYRCNNILNLLTFVLCRFGGLIWITKGMLLWYNRVTPLYYCLLFMSMLAMTVINVILFWRLVKSDVFRSKNQSKNESSQISKSKRL